MHFSHSLRELLAKVKAKCPSEARGEDTTLRDQFAENVGDVFLKRELKKLIRRDQEVTFLEVREEALRWSEDDATVMVDKIESTPPPMQTKSDDIRSLLEAIQKQQQQIADLTKTVNEMKTNQGQQKRKVVCYNCQKPGHISRECRLPPMMRQQQPYVPYPAPQGNQPQNQLQHQPQPYPQLQHQPQPHPQFQAQHQSSDTQKQAPNGNPLLLGATPQREM